MGTKKYLLGVVFLIVLLPLIMAVTQYKTTFTNGYANETIYFNGSNIIRYISMPTYSNVNNFTMDFVLYNDSIISTTDNFNYLVYGTVWNDSNAIVDKNWDTAGAEVGAGGEGYLDINYSSLKNTLILNATWKVKDWGGTRILSISNTSTCLNAPFPRFKVVSYQNFQGRLFNVYYCYNSSSNPLSVKELLQTSDGDNAFYEQNFSYSIKPTYLYLANEFFNTSQLNVTNVNTIISQGCHCALPSSLDTNLCYQETAGVIDSCGDLKEGSYGFVNASNIANAKDGNYNTAATLSPISGYMYVNYTKFAGDVALRWQVKDDDTNYPQPKNLTIPNSCMSSTLLQLRVKSYLNSCPGTCDPSLSYECYNGATWAVIESRVGNTAYAFYEDAIFWQSNQCISSTYSCDIPISFYGEVSYSNINLTYSYGIVNCSSGGYPTINFSSYEENNRTPINQKIEGVATYTIDGVYYYNETFNYTSIQNFSLCITPNNTNLLANIYLQHQATGGIKERYYLDNITLTNTTQLVNLYNFVDITGLSELTAIVYNYYYSIYPGVIMKLQRYFPAINSWITVQVDKSDEFGKGLFYVYQNTVDYRFIWESAGKQLETKSGGGSTAPLKFICDTATECESSFVINLDASVDAYLGFGYTYSYNNNTGDILLSWSDTNQNVESVRLLVQQHKSNAVTTICDTTTASASGAISCNILAYSGLISVSAFRSASPADPFFSQIIEKALEKLADVLRSKGVEKDGIFLGFLLMVAIASMGVVSVGGSVILTMIGFAIMSIFGLFSFVNLAFVVGGCALALVVAYVVNR